MKESENMPDLLGEDGSDGEQESEESRVPKTKGAPHKPIRNKITWNNPYPVPELVSLLRGSPG